MIQLSSPFPVSHEKSDFLKGSPLPDPQALASSKHLQTLICSEIEEQGGHISFCHFMDMALHAPGLGYYNAGCHKFGEQGDFITAPEISSLFSQCVARSIQPVIATLDKGSVLEVGAGSGVMAVELLKEFSQLDCLPEAYYILELSAELRARQRDTIMQHSPALLEKVQWLDKLPEDFTGVVLANELLDTMPVHRFCITNHGPFELCVARGEQGFTWVNKAFSDQYLIQRITDIQIQWDTHLSSVYTSEINLSAEAWLRSVSESLKKGLILLFDYGFAAHEYYHPQRDNGTLMCHYRHRAHGDPLILVGLQDITAHIDFTAMAAAAKDSGLALAGYTTQAEFLLTSGLPELISKFDSQDSKRHIMLTAQVKKLTMPHEMGELFKVMAFTQNMDHKLASFSRHDLRNRL